MRTAISTAPVPYFGYLHSLFWPTLFILMWSSGYVAGKVGLPYAGPFTLIFIRFSTAAAILLVIALITKAPWPATRKQWMHIIIGGILIQALQFSGLYYGLSRGVSAGISALIVGMMPIFTAAGAVYFLNEKVSKTQLMGLALGLLGIGTVVSHKISFENTSLAGYVAIGIALAGITLGTLYQKKYCTKMDLRTGGFIQLTAASLIVGALGFWQEGLNAEWTSKLIFSSLWLSIVNSIGAISVLFLMVRRGEASRVASLFYLIPSVTAFMGYLILGETLSPQQMIGFLISASGVYLSTRS